MAPKKFRLVLINQRWIREGYLGEEPPSPTPSVPNLIKILLNAKTWKCSAGNEPLALTPVTIRVGFLNLFKEALDHPDRKCPIVYVTREFESGEPLVDVNELARVLVGTAVVYVAESPEADKETEELFERSFRCWGGMIRVYQPGVKFRHPRDSIRHRFFTKDIIQSLGTEEVILQIVRACCRRAYLLRPGDVASTDEIASRARIQRLRELAAQKETRDPEFEELIESVQEDNDKYRKEIEDLRQELELKSLEVDERDDKIRSIEYEFDSYKLSAQDAYSRCDELQKGMDALESLRKLPDSLLETLELMEKLHAGRIVVLDDARRSAETASLDKKYLDTAWSCLWVMATDLHDLYFLPDQPTDKEKAFKAMTGFELALKEGRQTNRDAKFAQQRQRDYDGRTVDITPHLKWGNKSAKCLRAHFYVDQEKKRLVIGHCGDHLDNYSTRAQK